MSLAPARWGRVDPGVTGLDRGGWGGGDVSLLPGGRRRRQEPPPQHRRAKVKGPYSGEGWRGLRGFESRSSFLGLLASLREWRPMK